MTEPTTAAACPCAGRCHHDVAPCSLGCWAAQKPWKPAEAVVAALSRVRDRVGRAKPKRNPMGTPEWYFDGWDEARAAVLAILDEEAGRKVNPLSNFGDDENDRMPWQQDEYGEAEAVADALARVRERVGEELPRCHSHPSEMACTTYCLAGYRSAVLAIIEEEAGPRPVRQRHRARFSGKVG